MTQPQAPEIIDLTSMPSPEIFVPDSDEKGDPETTTHFVLTSGSGHEKEKKESSRRKKWKRPSVDGEGQGSSANTRDNENGRMDARSPQKRRDGSHNGSRTTRADEPKEQWRHRTRDQHSQGQSLPARPRSHSPHRRRKRSASPQSPRDTSDLYYIDIKPAQLPSAAQFVTTHGSEQAEGTTKLLLPAHVSVFGTVPVEILPPSAPDSDEEDYIDYIDYDDRKDLVRYFDEQVDDVAKPSRTVCKNCGAEGEHKTMDCPVLICLTCGARDEHLTRSCPINKTCYSCGMKGHINSNCPNRHSARAANTSKYDDCDRCGSRVHITNECPTLWRLYDYLTDDEKSDSIRVREEKSKLSLGQGGEGYIAGDEWCYNCAGSGHWGDDCNDLPHRADHPREPSAFSSYNILSGPFFDPTAKPTPKTFRRREPRDWEQANDLPEGWGNHAPENVGKQGRRKNIAKMERRARQQVVDDDPDDWFGNPRNARGRGTMSVLSQHSGGSGKEPPTGPKKLTFGSSLKDAERRFRSRPFTTTSLLDRLGGDDDRASSRGQYNERRSDHNSSWETSRSKHDLGHDAHGKQRDGYGREGDRNRHRPRDEPGPRYKGGYRR